MKKSLILIIAVLLIGLSGYNQTTEPLKLSAGDELILSSKNYYTGILLTTLGTGVTIAGSFIKPDINPTFSSVHDDNKGKRNIVYAAGGFMSIIGIIYIIESHSHIKRAGLILNENGIGIKYKL